MLRMFTHPISREKKCNKQITMCENSVVFLSASLQNIKLNEPFMAIMASILCTLFSMINIYYIFLRNRLEGECE